MSFTHYEDTGSQQVHGWEGAVVSHQPMLWCWTSCSLELWNKLWCKWVRFSCLFKDEIQREIVKAHSLLAGEDHPGLHSLHGRTDADTWVSFTCQRLPKVMCPIFTTALICFPQPHFRKMKLRLRRLGKFSIWESVPYDLWESLAGVTVLACESATPLIEHLWAGDFIVPRFDLSVYKAGVIEKITAD